MVLGNFTAVSDISLCESCLQPCKMYMVLFGSIGATCKSKIFHIIELKIRILASPYGGARQREKMLSPVIEDCLNIM